MKKAV